MTCRWEHGIVWPSRDSHWIHVGLTLGSRGIHKNEKNDAEAALKVFLGGAPFPLQRDSFSCRDAPDFNRTRASISSIHAGLQATVDAQAQITPVFALNSPLPRPAMLRTLGKR